MAELSPTTKAVIDDIHYEWELEDASGEWAAGGSGNDLSATVAEGKHYLMVYSQDGPHKLVVRMHRTSTIYEFTNG